MNFCHELHELHDFFVFLQPKHDEVRRFRESLCQVAAGVGACP